jgi:GTP-binding protein EngB required for normal cell division
MDNISTPTSISNIRDHLEILASACNRFQIVSLTRQLEVAQTLVSENPPIDVAVLGQFKAGKSSFLNNLICHNVLPVGAIPVTTVITRVQYGAREKAFIKHFTGTITEVPLTDIVQFTSEAENPGNSKNVAVVDIELTSMRDYQGLRLVDTPGLGSVYKYHQSTSEEWLPSVGTAILAVSSDRPLSEHDLDLIRELTNHTPNIILLLTKADILLPEQQNEVIAFFQQTLQRELHRELHRTLPVYLYSIKRNTEEYKQRIEQDILKTICKNRDAEFLRILNYKIHSLSQSCLSYLKIALQSSLQADMNRENLRAQILNEKVNEDLVREELGIIAREHQRQTRPVIETYLEQFRSPLTKKAIKKLEIDITSWHGNLWKLSRKYETWVSETLSEELRLISKNEHNHFFGTMKKAHASFSRALESFCMFLSDNIETVLGVKMVEMNWKIDVTEPNHPDISFTNPFDIHLDLIWFLIPMFLFRKVFEQHFIANVPKEVTINISRLAYQWEKSINNAIEEMRLQSINYIHEELTTIENLISGTKGHTDEIKKLIAHIEKSFF